MSLRFSKMHGAGNDFVIIDGRERMPVLDRLRIAQLGDRHRGVGFDQLLSIEPARDSRCAFYYGVWNADGSAAAQCGNGIRCVAAWLHRDGAVALDTELRLQSPSGPLSVQLLDPLRVAVNMGVPQFAPAHIGLRVKAAADRYPLTIDTETVAVAAVSMGNPHAVLVVDDGDDPRWTTLAPKIASHAAFAHGCNVGVAQILARDRIQLRVHERGSGWTLACGSGACAAAAVLHRAGRVDDRVRVTLPGGELDIDWRGGDHPLWMTGPARFVYEGQWHQPVP